MKTSEQISSYRHFLYVLSSQIIILVIGFVKALIIPVAISLEDYGYWQIYVFYTVYVGIFSLGYNDGLYLRYGGFAFQKLPMHRIRTSNLLYLLLIASCAVSLTAFATFNDDPNRQLIFLMVAGNVAVLCLISNISLTLQATNRLKSFAIINSSDKIFFGLALIALVQDELRSFVYLIGADFISKLTVLIVLVLTYRTLFFGHFAHLREGIEEFRKNIGVGAHLLLANLSGMLVLGSGRLIVEYFGVIEGYAHYAFSITITNIVLVSVTALSIVLYPNLKRLPEDNYLKYFDQTNSVYMVFALLMLIAYFPAFVFIEKLAINYKPVLDFLNVMFVITIIQGKMQLINNTYYKALRLEKPMLIANFSALVVVLALAGIGYWLTKSIIAIVYSTLAVMVFRVYASELFLRKHMGEDTSLKSLSDLPVLFAFLALTSFVKLEFLLPIWLSISIALLIKQRQIVLGLVRDLRSRTQ